MAEFDVESYTVAAIQRGLEPSGAYRKVTLTSPALAHGIRNRASIYFFHTSDSHQTMGVVSNVDQLNYDGHLVFAYLWKDDFADWYDILRNEQPLKFRYFYEGEGSYDPDQPRRSLKRVWLYTGLPEPPGEGEDDLELRRAAPPEATDGGGT